MDRAREHTVHRMTDETFRAALAKIQKGKIPDNFPDVVAHVKGTIHELMEFAGAITECALRLNNDNAVLRDILEKADVRYEYTPDGPRRISDNQEDEK